jgi:hypothetical protein
MIFAGMSIKNSNGKTYRVLASKNDYMLLLDNKTDELVIAYKYSEKTESWEHGYYYSLDNLHGATRYMTFVKQNKSR